MSQSIKEFTHKIERTIAEDVLSENELDSIYNRLFENQKISLDSINRYYFLNLIFLVSFFFNTK